MGELAAELDRQYWLEADTSVLLDTQIARSRQLEATVAQLQQELSGFASSQPTGAMALLKLKRKFKSALNGRTTSQLTGTSRIDGYRLLPASPAPPNQSEQIRRQLEATEVELARVRQVVESTTASLERVQTLRLGTEASYRRLEDYLALLSTVTIYEMPALLESDRADVLERKLKMP